MKATERLYLTADRTTLVREGDKAGATLYAAPGDEIPPKTADLFGLVDGAIPEGRKKAVRADVKESKADAAADAAAKEAATASDKEQKAGQDKAAGDAK